MTSPAIGTKVSTPLHSPARHEPERWPGINRNAGPASPEYAAGIDTALIDPGKPWQNGADESFNGKFRDECLSMEWFRSRAEAKVVIEQWRQHYNADRPHSSLGYLTPLTFKQQDPEQQNKILQKQERKQKPSTNPGAILN